MNKTTFLSDEEYQLAFDIMGKTSIHETQIFEIFIKNIESKIQYKNSFLDIGAGPGSLTKQISPYFNETTVIEPNKFYYSKYDTSTWNLITTDFLINPLSTKNFMIV